MAENQSSILDRILQQSGDEELLNKLAALSPSDLQTLLMEVFANRSSRVTQPQLLREYQSNRFVKPATIDPIAYLHTELKTLTLAREMGIELTLLSPAGQLYSCSAMASVSQNKVLSALRGTEVLADPTNMLALIIADRLQKKVSFNSGQYIHASAACRVARGQVFSGPNSFSHFGLFCMVSSGQDTGSYTCEHSLIATHLAYYDRLFREELKTPLHLVLKMRGGYKDGQGFLERTAGHIQKMLPALPLTFETAESDNAYYRGINFKLMIPINGKLSEVGDGGFVDWTQKLLGNKKERLLISAIGLDRLISLQQG